jgi:hypothetical protein
MILQRISPFLDAEAPQKPGTLLPAVYVSLDAHEISEFGDWTSQSRCLGADLLRAACAQQFSPAVA